MKNYETVSEAVNDLVKRGYTADFNIHNEEDCLVCGQGTISLSPEEFEIDEIYRFEGNTDPGNEMIVYAISASKQNVKGILVNAYGIYADAIAAKTVKRLISHL